MTTEKNTTQEIAQGESFYEEETPEYLESAKSWSSSSAAEPSNKKGFAITSMVCGICALVFTCLSFISLPLSIISIVLGTISIKRKSPGKNMAISGIVCGIIPLVLQIISYILLLTTGFVLNGF